MRIEKAVGDSHAVLHLKGEFDTFHCAVLAEEIEALVTGGISRVVLNMRFTTFVNSTALGAMIKAKRRLRDAGGDLAIAHPSAFVKSVFEKVGLDRAFKVFPDDAEALAHLESQGPVEVQDPSAVLFTFTDAVRRKILGREVGVGRLAAIDEQGLDFAFGGADHRIDPTRAGEMFGAEPDCKVKFRLPLYKKTGHFEVPSKIERFKPEPDGSVRVRARFGTIAPEDQDSIRQFVRDMRFLKSELREATKKG